MADQILMCVETSPDRVGKHKARNSTNYFGGLAKLPGVQNKKVDFSGLPLLRTFKNIVPSCLQDANNILNLSLIKTSKSNKFCRKINQSRVRGSLACACPMHTPCLCHEEALPLEKQRAMQKQLPIAEAKNGQKSKPHRAERNFLLTFFY